MLHRARIKTSVVGKFCLLLAVPRAQFAAPIPPDRGRALAKTLMVDALLLDFGQQSEALHGRVDCKFIREKTQQLMDCTLGNCLRGQ